MSTEKLLIDSDGYFGRRPANFPLASLFQLLTVSLSVIAIVLVIHEGARLTEKVATQGQELSTLKTVVSDYQEEMVAVKAHQEAKKDAEVTFLRERAVALEAKLPSGVLADGDTNLQSELGDKVDPVDMAGGATWRSEAVQHQRAKRAANSVTYPSGEPTEPTKPTEPLTCPSGYLQFRDKCYQFSTTQKQYNDAKAVCVASGGHLAVAKDEATDNFLVNEIRKRGNAETWMGMSDQVEEGVWVWEDGSALTGWTNWLPGNPSSTFEDCAEWKVVYGFKWNDDECYHTQYFVCENHAT
ncbi:COLEC10 [Branchiostoma lanceolatum]|uniref:COLEC10 protein n=1 Tax=Branchiostoma lanceolatum TaxID=7740 RepID=A0A8J9VQ42_BRALA|nr:COLEC10 [Branchiostoma lanceolatum]